MITESEPSLPSLPSVKSGSGSVPDFDVRSSMLDVRCSSPSLLFAVPQDDASQSEFNSLPAAVRDDVDRSLLALERIHGAPKVNPEIKAIAAYYHGRPGFTFNSLRAKYYWFTSSGKSDEYGNLLYPPGDWRLLVNWCKVPRRNRPGAESGPSSQTLSSVFVDFLKGLYQSNQRKSEPAIRKLYALWRAGESIPGYGTWEEWFQTEHPHLPLPDHCPPDLPRGWHKSTLRKHIPDDAELALARQGKSAAMQLLPCILQTREGLRPLEFIEFDDFRTDFKVLVPGYASPVELNGLVAIDVATGRPLRYGLRAAIPREDGMKDKLKLHDMKVLIAGILLQYGLPVSYPMTLIVENATATVRDAFALALAELFPLQSNLAERPGVRLPSGALSSSLPSLPSVNGRSGSESGIIVQKTEILQGTALWAGYKDRPGGNPRGKPHVESTFNLFHNEAGFIKGQIGRRYDAGPSELHGRTREAESLARVGRHLTPHQRAALKMPFLNYAEARVVCTDIWNRIYQRTDHQMEAFSVIGEFRLDEHDQWRPDSHLVTDPSLAHVNRDLLLWRNPARRESPAERWERLCWEELFKVQGSGFKVQGSSPSPIRVDSCSLVGTVFRRPHPSAIARLYDEHKLRPVVNYEITFDHDKEHCVYRIANLQFGRPQSLAALKNDCRVLCYFDPQDLSIIHVTDGQGGYLGSIPRTRGIRKTDKDALRADYERKQGEYQQLKDLVNSRLPEAAEERLSEIDHNCEVLKTALEQAEGRPTNNTNEHESPLIRADSCTLVGTASSSVESLPEVVTMIDAHTSARAVAQRQLAAARARIAAAPRSLKSILAGHEARTQT